MGLAALATAGGTLVGLAGTAGAAGGSVNLVAYSTPKPAYSALIAAFSQPGRAGRHLLPVLRRLGHPGHRGGQRAPGRRRQLLDRASTWPRWSRPASSRLVGQHPDQGHGDQLHRLVHRAQGQPQAHQDLGRPGQVRASGHHAQPLQLGQRQVEPHGRLRRRARPGQDAGAGQHLPVQAPEEHRGPAQQRQHRPADVPVGPGRRAPRLRGRRALRQEPGRAGHRRHAAADDPDPEPDRGDQEWPAAAAKAFVAYLLSPAGQKIWGKQGYRPVLPSVAAQFNFPKPKTLFTIDSLGGWTSVNTKFFDPATGHRGQDRAGARRLDRRVADAAPAVATGRLPAAGRRRRRDRGRPARGRRRRLVGRRRPGAGRHLPEPAGAAAAGRLVTKAFSGGSGRSGERSTNPRPWPRSS